jgi:hypothetical protein
MAQMKFARSAFCGTLYFFSVSAGAEPLVTLSADEQGKSVSRTIDCGLLRKNPNAPRDLLVNCAFVEQVRGDTICFDTTLRRDPRDADDAKRLSSSILATALRHLAHQHKQCMAQYAEVELRAGSSSQRLDALLGTEWRRDDRANCILRRARDLCKQALGAP